MKSFLKKTAKRSLTIKLALLEIIHGDRKEGTDLLRELVAQDKKEIQAREVRLL